MVSVSSHLYSLHKPDPLLQRWIIEFKTPFYSPYDYQTMLDQDSVRKGDILTKRNIMSMFLVRRLGAHFIDLQLADHAQWLDVRKNLISCGPVHLDLRSGWIRAQPVIPYDFHATEIIPLDPNTAEEIATFF